MVGNIAFTAALNNSLKHLLSQIQYSTPKPDVPAELITNA
jgi:hypothetical protein